MAINRSFCVPCVLGLQKTHILKRVSYKNEKITCWHCKKRRYGAKYSIEKRGVKDTNG